MENAAALDEVLWGMGKEPAAAAASASEEGAGAGAGESAGESARRALEAGAVTVGASHFRAAMGQLRASVSKADLRRYELLRERFG